jgi:hypothetical protein
MRKLADALFFCYINYNLFYIKRACTYFQCAAPLSFLKKRLVRTKICSKKFVRKNYVRKSLIKKIMLEKVCLKKIMFEKVCSKKLCSKKYVLKKLNRPKFIFLGSCRCPPYQWPWCGLCPASGEESQSPNFEKSNSPLIFLQKVDTVQWLDVELRIPELKVAQTTWYGIGENDKMSNDKMSNDKMLNNKMSNNKMSSNKMLNNKMPAQKMSTRLVWHFVVSATFHSVIRTSTFSKFSYFLDFNASLHM